MTTIESNNILNALLNLKVGLDPRYAFVWIQSSRPPPGFFKLVYASLQHMVICSNAIDTISVNLTLGFFPRKFDRSLGEIKDSIQETGSAILY